MRLVNQLTAMMQIQLRASLLFHEIDKNEEFETLLDKKITLTGNNAVFSLNDNVINLAGCGWRKKYVLLK
jgi:hypothetical protein